MLHLKQVPNQARRLAEIVGVLLARNFAEEPSVHLPAVHPDRSGRRVLTMELLNGIPGSNSEKIPASGVDLNAFARAAANVFGT